MKKLFFVFAVGLLFVTSCTNDAEITQKLTGEWVIMDDNNPNNEPLHYTFQDNGFYQRYWTDSEIDLQEGVWSIKNAKLNIYVLGAPIEYKYIISGDVLTLNGVNYKKK